MPTIRPAPPAAATISVDDGVVVTTRSTAREAGAVPVALDAVALDAAAFDAAGSAFDDDADPFAAEPWPGPASSPRRSQPDVWADSPIARAIAESAATGTAAGARSRVARRGGAAPGDWLINRTTDLSAELSTRFRNRR